MKVELHLFGDEKNRALVDPKDIIFEPSEKQTTVAKSSESISSPAFSDFLDDRVPVFCFSATRIAVIESYDVVKDLMIIHTTDVLPS